MNDIYDALMGLFKTKTNDEQWGMSYAGNEFGMSLPESHPVAPEVSVKADEIKSTALDNILSSISKNNIYKPAPASDATGAINSTNQLLGDYLGTTKEAAGKAALYGASLKTAAAAGKLFNSILTYSSGMKVASMQAENTKLQADVQMAALDNQVLYYKNQITDKFNSLLARNTVTMATKGLRVSAGQLLEGTKDAAYDATQDIRTLESNAELKKIALRSSQRQADITKKLQKTLLTANLVQGVADMGLMVASGGGTGQSWGDLWSNAGFGSKAQSLNETVYGSK